MAFTDSSGRTKSSMADINITPLVDVVLVLLVIGALASSVWLHSRIHGNEWGQNFDGAIQANLVSNAPAIPLPQV
ncbi:MAG TPA: hypothetical protein VE109_12030, partial [Acidobacteriaceae bacterium]|nr:hypothetical protein [Acidobacteriaceae bacterium]